MPPGNAAHFAECELGYLHRANATQNLCWLVARSQADGNATVGHGYSLAAQ